MSGQCVRRDEHTHNTFACTHTCTETLRYAQITFGGVYIIFVVYLWGVGCICVYVSAYQCMCQVPKCPVGELDQLHGRCLKPVAIRQ